MNRRPGVFGLVHRPGLPYPVPWVRHSRRPPGVGCEAVAGWQVCRSCPCWAPPGWTADPALPPVVPVTARLSPSARPGGKEAGSGPQVCGCLFRHRGSAAQFVPGFKGLPPSGGANLGGGRWFVARAADGEHSRATGGAEPAMGCLAVSRAGDTGGVWKVVPDGASGGLDSGCGRGSLGSGARR